MDRPKHPLPFWGACGHTATDPQLGAHAGEFKKHLVDGKLLLTLTEQDMYATLNIVSPLHRKKLALAIGDLRKAALNP